MEGNLLAQIIEPAGNLLTTSEARQILSQLISDNERLINGIEYNCKRCSEGNNGVCNISTNERCQKFRCEKVNTYIQAFKDCLSYLNGYPDVKIWYIENIGMCAKLYKMRTIDLDGDENDKYTIEYIGNEWKAVKHTGTIYYYDLIDILDPSVIKEFTMITDDDNYTDPRMLYESKKNAEIAAQYHNKYGYTIRCRNCGRVAYFTNESMKFLEEKGYEFPVRCVDCKRKRNFR